MSARLTAILAAILFCVGVSAQDHGNHNENVSPSRSDAHHTDANPTGADAHAGEAAAHGEAHADEKYDPSPAVMHHIGDAHELHVLPGIAVPLPCLPYVPGQGLKFFMSSAFHHGQKAVHGFALDHGILRRIADFPVQEGEVELSPIADEHGHGDGHASYIGHREVPVEGKKPAEQAYVMYEGKEYILEESAKLTSKSSWYDFSITKNVFTMLMAMLLLFFVFRSVAGSYRRRPDEAPKGLQGFIEPFFIFIRDEVAKPSIGPKYEKYLPLLLSLFFFILINNLFGLIPFFPFGANVMGNISSTIVLAVVVFLVVNFSGNKSYWTHIFWMPDVPVFIKILFIPIEVASLFIKPFTLLIRLFANITAGHTIILTFVSLIFIFGKVGQSIGGAVGGSLIAVPFVAFMNVLEILVAFLQAFIFTLLSSLYIGSAIEEHHHHDDHAHAH